MSKSRIAILIALVSGLVLAIYFTGYKRGRESGARQMARHISNPRFRTDSFDIIVEEEKGDYEVVWASDPNNDPNHIDYCDPNDPWMFDPPENPVIYINEDTFRLQPGSSIKYIEIGDPCVVVSYIKPTATGGGIEIDVNDPNTYSGFLITNCSFNMIDPDCDGSSWYCNRCKYPPSSTCTSGITKFIWPEVFTNEHFEYPNDSNCFAMATADGLMGWGNCYAGEKPPSNFGKAMLKISKIVGTATPDGLMEVADDPNNTIEVICDDSEIELDPTTNFMLSAIFEYQSDDPCEPGYFIPLMEVANRILKIEARLDIMKGN